MHSVRVYSRRLVRLIISPTLIRIRLLSLADLYKQTLSQLSFRIRVTGNPTYLQNAATADKVRAILLSGIRAAILWRQVGGRRWQLLFSRRRYSDICRDLLTESDHNS